jgi:hypothetical protein
MKAPFDGFPEAIGCTCAILVQIQKSRFFSEDNSPRRTFRKFTAFLRWTVRMKHAIFYIPMPNFLNRKINE